MRFTKLLLCGALALASSSAMSAIVNGVRQKPTYETSGFVVNQEVYLLNVDAGQFFTQGNSWQTQASVGTEGRLVKFTQNSSTDYQMLCYCWRSSSDPGGYMAEGWRNVFFEETALFVDRNNQTDYFFAVEDHGSTFRLFPSSNNPTYGDYDGANLYVGLTKNSSSTALSPFVDEDEAYVDWAVVTVEAFESVADEMAIYEKAQTLKAFIDLANERGLDASEVTAVYLNEDATMEELEQAIAAAKVLLRGEDVTSYIANPGFDEDLTFQTDGTMKGTVNTKSLSDRSWANIAEDNSVYARPKESSSFSRPDGRKMDAVNGFIGQIKGWTVETNQDFPQCEWVYFGSVPYNLGETAVPIADNGTSYLAVPSRPAEDNGDDNKGAVHLRAGWGGSCSYKQTVKLPCAQYRLEYWVRNTNYAASKNNTGVKNLSKVNCRRYEFIDEDGFNAEEWVQHTIEFTPITEFSMQFGFQSSGGSASNPFIWIDGIKLYKIGEADPVELLKSEIIDMLQIDLPALNPVDADGNTLAGLKKQIEDIPTADYWQLVDYSFDQEKLQQAYEELKTVINSIQTALAVVPTICQQLAQADGLLAEAENTVHAEALQTARNEVYGIVYTTGDAATIIANEQTLVEAINFYNNAITLGTHIKQLSDAIIASKVNVEVRQTAENQLAASQELYIRGNITDEELTEQVELISALLTALTESAALYEQLAEALPVLETAVTQKAMQSLLDEATTLLNETQEGYEAGSIADIAIPDIITSINDKVAAINASAEAYTSLKEAIDRLEAAIEEVGDQATKSSLKKANLRLTATKRLYDNGTIADEDIPARIEAIDQLIDELTASIRLRQQYDEAIENLDVAVSSAAVSATMMDNATALQATIKTDYEEGNVDDANIEAEITKINNIITNLEAATDLYANIDAEQGRLDQLAENIVVTQQTVVSTEARSAEVYLATSEKTKFADALAVNKNALDESITNKNAIASQLAETTALDAITLTVDNTSTFATIEGQVTNIQVSISNELTAVDNIQSDVTNALDEAIEASQYIADIKGEFATFCSTADLDFTDVTGVKAYVASDFEADGLLVKMTQVTNVPAGTGVLLVAEEAGEYQIPAGSSAADFTNMLVGVTEATVVAATNGTNRNFILANGGEGVAFYPLKEGKLAAGKAYLPLPAAALSAGVKGISLTFEDLSTDIQHLLAGEEADGKWFDLSGKQLGRRPVKSGLYIHDGKKVVVK